MMTGPMLQALLEDRFRLKIHSETREIPIYELTVAKSGSKLKPFTEGSCTFRPPRDITKPLERPPALPTGQNYCALLGTFQGPNMVVDAQGISISEFSFFLEGSGRPVIDKTGIPGKFDFHLEYAPDEDQRRRVSDAGEPTAPSIFTAVQEQLGLKLESGKGHGDFFVIDHVERPSEN